jgi:predicted PhzF superfamily epimerase YddE/YHI9
LRFAVRAPITIVDAFSDRPFAGNQAGVCLLTEPAQESWMQSVAAEMNLSETAFLVPRTDGFDLRWFTPTVEVNLCGHATLASAHVLWESERLRSDQTARFHTKSGWLLADRVGDAIEMDFPAQPARQCNPPPDLLPSLNLQAEFVGHNGTDFLVVASSAAAVRGANPDHARLCSLKVRGVIVTAASDDKNYDFVSRFFAPGAGVPEDPVTGSAHCCVGPYWAERLGKPNLIGFQASRRTGIVRVRCLGERVKLVGKAVTVVRGELTA